jgi:hypothetical protein
LTCPELTLGDELEKGLFKRSNPNWIMRSIKQYFPNPQGIHQPIKKKSISVRKKSNGSEKPAKSKMLPSNIS